MSASMQNGPSLCMYMCNQCQWSLCVCVYILYVSDLHSGTDTFINVFVPTSSAKPCPDAYLHACIPTCLHAYIHTYIHTYTHTHIHTYTHMYLHPSLNPSHHAYMHAWSLIIVNLSLTHVLTSLGLLICSQVHASTNIRSSCGGFSVSLRSSSSRTH